MKGFLLAAWGFVLHDYRVRFGRTLFGMLWLLLPLFALVGVAMVVGRDAGLYASGESHTYFVRLVVGLVLWQLFADSWLEPMRLGRRANSLLRSVAFDQRVVLAAGALGALVAFAVKLPVLLGALLWYQIPLSWDWLVLPLGLLAIVAAGTTLACFTLPVSLVLLDVRYAMPLLQYALLLATPVFYGPRDGLVGQLNAINPLTYLVPAVRDILIGVGSVLPVIGASCVVAVLLMLALRYYGRRMGLIVAYIGL